MASVAYPPGALTLADPRHGRPLVVIRGFTETGDVGTGATAPPATGAYVAPMTAASSSAWLEARVAPSMIHRDDQPSRPRGRGSRW